MDDKCREKMALLVATYYSSRDHLRDGASSAPLYMLCDLMDEIAKYPLPNDVQSPISDLITVLGRILSLTGEISEQEWISRLSYTCHSE